MNTHNRDIIIVCVYCTVSESIQYKTQLWWWWWWWWWSIDDEPPETFVCIYTNTNLFRFLISVCVATLNLAVYAIAVTMLWYSIYNDSLIQSFSLLWFVYQFVFISIKRRSVVICSSSYYFYYCYTVIVVICMIWIIYHIYPFFHTFQANKRIWCVYVCMLEV